ncbi:hypothetical protein U0070_022043 [Myodes glareolus]|uniref:Uncharacterized protein n=1 Tax=Myodes glareolus TaxID=447135 RepID=A0AAW0I819_MYOGA
MDVLFTESFHQSPIGFHHLSSHHKATSFKCFEAVWKLFGGSSNGAHIIERRCLRKREPERLGALDALSIVRKVVLEEVYDIEKLFDFMALREPKRKCLGTRVTIHKHVFQLRHTY